MGNLFGSKAKIPDPTPPATMPDELDPLAKRARRRQAGQLQTESSSVANKIASVPGTIGREFSRSTLGAN